MQNGKHIFLIHSIIVRNEGSSGGGIYTNKCKSIKITYVSVVNNMVTSGTIYTITCPKILIDHCYFGKNHADEGGGLYCVEADYIMITSSLFIENFASEAGAIKIVTAPYRFNILLSNFTNNTAVTGGSSLVLLNSLPSISTFFTKKIIFL